MTKRVKEFLVEQKDAKAIEARLNKLPDSMQRAVLRPALRKAGSVVAKQARKNIPKGAGLRPNGMPRKHLKQVVKVTSVKWYRNNDVFAITIGPQKKAAPHAHLVHNGTKPRIVKLKKYLILNGTHLPPGTIIRQPGNKAQPYMDNAVKQTGPQAAAKLKEAIIQGIEKQTKKLAAKK